MSTVSPPDARGIINLFHAKSDIRLQMYVEYGDTNNDVLMNIVVKAGSTPSIALAYRLSGDVVSKLAENNAIEGFAAGKGPVRVMAGDREGYKLQFEPHPNIRGNGMLSSSNGFVGTATMIHNLRFPWLSILVLAVVVGVIVALVIIEAGWVKESPTPPPIPTTPAVGAKVKKTTVEGMGGTEEFVELPKPPVPQFDNELEEPIKKTDETRRK